MRQVDPFLRKSFSKKNQNCFKTAETTKDMEMAALHESTLKKQLSEASIEINSLRFKHKTSETEVTHLNEQLRKSQENLKKVETELVKCNKEKRPCEAENNSLKNELVVAQKEVEEHLREKNLIEADFTKSNQSLLKKHKK